MKKIDLTNDKAKNSPQGGVLVGKKDGQTIIYDDGKVGGWFVGKTHKEGGIQGIDKTTGQPIEVQTGEVIITAPALADQTPREFQGKMMTNREILSKINSDAGGVAFAEDGMEVSNKILCNGGQYNYGGKMMFDKDIVDEINKCGCEHDEKQHLSEGMSLEDIAKKHNVSLDDLQKQVEIGMKDESIHAGDYKDHFNIVKDHLVENPTFYTNEQKAQGEFANGVLIAPNGQPSGLYFTEIYNLVRTKEFKEWFGDWEEAYKTKDYDGVSKIIDENGEPLICVHNSPNEFFEFDEYKVGSTTDAGYYGKGFYFFPNVGFNKYGEIEYNCFLNIKNPYFKQSSHRNYELKSDELKNEGFDGVVVYPNFNEDFNFQDGVDKAEEIVAYYPEQIKLGDGTNTTFDKYNNDIRYDDGGEIENLYKNENDYVKNLVSRNLQSDIAEAKLKKYIQSKNVETSSGLLPNEIINDSKYKELKRNFDKAFSIDRNKPTYKYPKNRDRVQEQKDRKRATEITKKIIEIELKKESFNDGGEMKKENLVKDAKDGNTPARDLNNYNDMLDVQADGEVGGDTGIFADGGGVGSKKEKSFESEGSTEGKGKLYEFFTPQIVADKMLALAQHYGFKGGNVLEPATGSGRLIKNLKDTNITAFEISKDNFEILKREFPNSELYNFNFEKAFLKEPRFNTLINRKGTETWLKNAPFDLVLANPPYGKFSGLYSSYFKFKGQVEHFFILQTLYLLKKGGLGVYLIPSSFMRNGISYNNIKKEIFEIAELVDAYRLPSNIFEKTQIGTDILILRKK